MNLLSLQAVLDDLLSASVHAATGDQNGAFLPSDRPIARLGLALEPFPDLAAWVAAERLDALFLHRPWGLTDAQRRDLLTNQVGVLAYHLAFDERLTTGFNPVLAAACGWHPPVLLGEKAGRPLGMTCALPHPTPFDELAAQLAREFGGPLELRRPRRLRPKDGICDHFPVEKVAVVGAMTDALVRAACDAGADVYVTGQFRQPARRAVEETGLGVVVLGHHRSEVWGLRALARLLRTHPAAAGLKILGPEIL